MNRAGLLNFWYYDEEQFDFSDGKLLLRGSNGSGKSVTMQSFLPVLLDGKKSPDRLDPFGSKARRMEDYLLGEKEVVDRDERTGYLYIEYKKGNTDHYITTGIGLQAKRNKPMKFWGFVITDNRRIGEGIELFKYENSSDEKQKIPRSRVELETVIGEGGYIVQTQKEYMALVNKYIFGFDTLEAYEDLIKLLIQLRSPKLSKDFRPTVIYEILEAALPPLTEDDLRHLSDTIEQMDETRQQIEQLEREWHAIQSLNRAYDTYNQRRLAEQGQEWIKASKKLGAEQKLLTTFKEQETQLMTDIEALIGEQQVLKQKQAVNEKQKERLRSHKIWDLEKELQGEKDRRNEEELKRCKQEESLHKNEQKEHQLRLKNQESEMKAEQLEAEITDALEDMGHSASEASFQKHEMNVADYERKSETVFDYSIWNKEAKAHLEQLTVLVEQFREFDRVKELYESRNLDRAEEQKKLDQKRSEEKEWLHLFEEDKNKKRAELHEWVQEISWVHDQSEKLQQSSRLLEQLYESTQYEQVRVLYYDTYLAFQNEENQKLSRLTFERKQLEEQRQAKKEEWQVWKNQKDPEPPLAKESRQAREQLKKMGHSFMPFYAAVDFNDHISADVQSRIESVLMETGILNALVVDSEVQVEHDRVLTPTPVFFQQTLADFMKLDSDIASQNLREQVDAVLRSIVVTKSSRSTVVQDDGSYQIGLLQGHALPYEEVRYIGKTARARYRKEKMLELEQEIAVLTERIGQVAEQIGQVEQRLVDARGQMDGFPNDRDLQESYRQIKSTRFDIEQLKGYVEKLDHELQRIYISYQEKKYLINEQARHFNIEKKLSSYMLAKQEMANYKDQLSKLEKLHIKRIHELELLKRNKDELDEVKESVDELKGELNIADDLLIRLRQNIEKIEEQMRKEGAEDIRLQIRTVEEALTQIDHNLDRTKQELPKKENELEHVKEKITTQQHFCLFLEKAETAWATTFAMEYSYYFVWPKEGLEGLESRNIAEKAIKEYGHLVVEKDSSRVDSLLSSTFFSEGANLMEYRMSDYTKPAPLSDWMNEVPDEYRLYVEQWKSKASRRIVDLDYQGKRVSPYFVQDVIEQDREQREHLLNEQDQRLYEDILYKSVGSKLRSRIRRAKDWTRKMKSLMETRDTSSGLTFSIRWKPRTADLESELDTQDLVDLLMQDARLLKDEDLDRITGHFRSKIHNAKQLLEHKTQGQTLIQVLKEVLDYRKWFSFVLSYKRENEPRRELTNHAFYQFSGGEKAMAMYIPLFTACYSRYQEADEAAPYIISLDEAFAGVDENNIREMFEVVESLGFNYIMNSQVLWGDYDTVSSLSICELVRPKNADFVSVIQYEWDGASLLLSGEKEEILT
ncbi:hypothetical protein AB990_17250 [Alkalihalobacillus pseudalcaliphilus]|nr:hypothetical protein AB990_17250 [Alkalihalobacillus pseudalcaliphilus]